MKARDPVTAKSRGFASGVAWPWIRRRMGRIFFSVDALGLDHLRGALASGPVLLYSNHSCWWDGFVDFALERHLGFDLYVMMEAANLEKNAFLRRLGAFDVDLASPKGAALALRTARRVLAGGPRRLVVIYPEGKMSSPRRRPISFRPGLEWLLEKTPEATAVPLARFYEFVNEDRPHVFLRFGPPLKSSSTATLQRALETELDALGAQVDRRSWEGFERLFQSKLSINKRWEQWRVRAFGAGTVDPLNR